MGCLDEETVLRFLGGGLSVGRLNEIDRHLDGCQACFALVVAAGSSSRGTPGAAAADRSPPGPMALPADQLLAGRYRLRRALGEGASGRVFEAFDELAQAPVALKVLRPDLAADPRWIRRLTRELQLGRRIDHRNVCRVLNMETGRGDPFLVMELAEGSLRAELQAAEPATRSRQAVLADARAIASGLAAIHAAGIVHRDVKPENVLRMAGGRLVVSDFGLAALSTGPATLTLYVGTPSYMAPELMQGEPATVASDIWSLGVVLHELLFGSRPRWKPGSRRKVLEASAGAAGPGERALERLCTQCLSIVPEERPPNVEEIVRRLQEAEAGPAALPAGRRRMVVALALLSSSAGAGSLLLWALASRPPAPAVAPAAAPVTPAVVRPRVLVKRDFSRSMPPAAAAAVEKVITDSVREIPNLEVGQWTPPADRKGQPASWLVVLDSGPQDSDRQADVSKSGAVPVYIAVIDPEGGQVAFSAQRCPASDLVSCAGQAAPIIRNSLRTNVVAHLVRERALREAGNPQARLALDLYFGVSPAERASGESRNAGRYLELALQADPRSFAVRLEKAALAVNGMARELPSDQREALRREVEELRASRPGEQGVATLHCRALTAFALVRTPTDEMLRAAERACHQALRSEIDDRPLRFALARLRAQWCDAEGAALQLQQVINTLDGLAGRVPIRTRTTRAGALAHLLLVDSLIPDESPSHWAMTTATINGGGELERSERDQAEQSLRIALLESRTQQVWRGGAFSPGDAARTAAVLTGLLQAGRLPDGEVDQYRREVADLERIVSIGGLTPSDFLPYLWVDPGLALKKLKGLSTGTNCGDLIKSATIYHALGDRPARDGALGACPRDDQWIRDCRARLSGPLEAAASLALTR